MKKQVKIFEATFKIEIKDQKKFEEFLKKCASEEDDFQKNLKK